jgi:hypothetical protein
MILQSEIGDVGSPTKSEWAVPCIPRVSGSLPSWPSNPDPGRDRHVRRHWSATTVDGLPSQDQRRRPKQRQTDPAVIPRWFEWKPGRLDHAR